MGRAASGRLGNDAGELDELRFHWGSAYDIGSEGGAYTARRRDGKGAILADALPEGLRLQIVADYKRMAVPRSILHVADRQAARAVSGITTGTTGASW